MLETVTGDSVVTPLVTCPGCKKDVSTDLKSHTDKCIPFWMKRCENSEVRAKRIVNHHGQSLKKKQDRNNKKRKPKVSTQKVCKLEKNVVQKAKGKGKK